MPKRSPVETLTVTVSLTEFVNELDSEVLVPKRVLVPIVHKALRPRWIVDHAEDYIFRTNGSRGDRAIVAPTAKPKSKEIHFSVNGAQCERLWRSHEATGRTISISSPCVSISSRDTTGKRIDCPRNRFVRKIAVVYLAVCLGCVGARIEASLRGNRVLICYCADCCRCAPGKFSTEQKWQDRQQKTKAYIYCAPQRSEHRNLQSRPAISNVESCNGVSFRQTEHQ